MPRPAPSRSVSVSRSCRSESCRRERPWRRRRRAPHRRLRREPRGGGASVSSGLTKRAATENATVFLGLVRPEAGPDEPRVRPGCERLGPTREQPMTLQLQMVRPGPDAQHLRPAAKKLDVVVRGSRHRHPEQRGRRGDIGSGRRRNELECIRSGCPGDAVGTIPCRVDDHDRIDVPRPVLDTCVRERRCGAGVDRRRARGAESSRELDMEAVSRRELPAQDYAPIPGNRGEPGDRCRLLLRRWLQGRVGNRRSRSRTGAVGEAAGASR